VGGLLGLALMVAEKKLAPLVDGKVSVSELREVAGEDGGKRNVRQGVELDAEGLAGFWQVEVQLGEVLPADEQANLVLALRSRQPGPDGRPMLSWETAVDRFKLAQSPADERMRIDREMAWNDPEVAALKQAVLVANVKQELMDELRRLGVNVERVLEQAAQRGQATADRGIGGTNLPNEGGLPAGMPEQGVPGGMQGSPYMTMEEAEGQPVAGMPPMY
jgi:hypothetical protein